MPRESGCCRCQWRFVAGATLIVPLLLVSAGLSQTIIAPRDRGDALLDETRRKLNIASQKVEAEIRVALRQSLRWSVTEPAKALERLKQVLEYLDNDTVLTEKRRAALRRMLKDRIRIAQAEMEQGVQRDLDKDKQRTTAIGRRQAEDQAAITKDRVRQGLDNVRGLQNAGRLDEASRAARDLAQQSPNIPSVQANRRISNIGEQVADNRRLQGDRERRLMGAYRDIDRSAMPPKDDIEFPPADKWRQISKRVKPKVTPQEQAILRALASPVTVSFDQQTSLESAIEYLQTLTGVPFVVDEMTLREMNITYETPVKAKVRGVSLRTLLRKMLGGLGLAYVVKDQVLQVTSAEKAKQMMTVRSYYLGDLVAMPNVMLAPAFNQIQMIQAANQLMQLIQSSVDPSSWRANGETGEGTITFDPRTLSLIIKQSAEVHYMLSSMR